MVKQAKQKVEDLVFAPEHLRAILTALEVTAK
jgi:hypothetical protein